MLTDRQPSHATSGAGARPRVLCVLDKHPLPADTGGRRRLWNILRGIASVATGTVVVLGGDTEPDRVDALAAELGSSHDAVYVSHPRPFVLVEELTDLPIIASIDDLAHVRNDRLETARAADPSRGPARPATDAAVDAAIDAADLRAWPRLYTRICARATVVLVPSPEDRAELRGGRVMVLPNGADLPAEPLRFEPHDAPAVLLHGQMLRASDADAAAFVVDHVLREVRRRVPGTRARIVGRTTDGIRALGVANPAVDIIGYVDDMAPELLRADVAVVPTRVAGGARHRILEAFAHGLPVVSTSAGMQGLDVTPGRHVLVADDATALADAITSILRDPALADALRAEGSRLVRERYDWAGIHHMVGEIVAGVIEHARTTV